MRNSISRQFHIQRYAINNLNSAIITSIGGLTGYLFLDYHLTHVDCSEELKSSQKHEIIRYDLPYFTEEEISRHNNKYHILRSPGVDTFDVIGNVWEIER